MDNRMIEQRNAALYREAHDPHYAAEDMPDPPHERDGGEQYPILPSLVDLTELVRTEVKRFAEEGEPFSAWDITLALRECEPGLEIIHRDVRALVISMYRAFDLKRVIGSPPRHPALRVWMYSHDDRPADALDMSDKGDDDDEEVDVSDDPVWDDDPEAKHDQVDPDAPARWVVRTFKWAVPFGAPEDLDLDTYQIGITEPDWSDVDVIEEAFLPERG